MKHSLLESPHHILGVFLACLKMEGPLGQPATTSLLRHLLGVSPASPALHQKPLGRCSSVVTGGPSRAAPSNLFPQLVKRDTDPNSKTKTQGGTVRSWILVGWMVHNHSQPQSSQSMWSPHETHASSGGLLFKVSIEDLEGSGV